MSDTAVDFDWLTLEPDEEILWSSQPELIGYAWVFVVGIALIPVIGLGLLVIAGTYLWIQNTDYVITTDSVFRKTGILSRTVTDIGHENIQDTSYRQSALGTHFGFGTVGISTAGGSGVEMRLSSVPDPLAVQTQLDQVAVRSRPGRDRERHDSDRSPAVEVDAETLEELVTEMRATREALESIEKRL